MKKIITMCPVLLLLNLATASITVKAELKDLDDNELTQATGRAGITLDAKADLGTGSRISVQIKKGANTNDQGWIVLDDLKGSVEFKGLKIDMVKNIGAHNNQTGLQVTLPNTIRFDRFSTGGVYIGPGKEKGADHHFLLSAHVDGALLLPAKTKATVFSIRP